MSAYAPISPAFERQKNAKAAGYTAVVCSLLFIVFFFAKWTLPQVAPPPAMEFVEVNLGNSDEGLGDVAPQAPGDPSSAKEETFTPAKVSPPPPQEQSIAGDENETDDAPVVNNTVKPVKKDIQRTIEPAKPVHAPITATPTPAPPKPKALYSGGTSNGTGGNGADSYNNVHNQGIAGGNGDQGKPNGNPNSDSYTGNGGSGGNSGVRIKSGLGGRRFTRLPSFEDDFNENAKVAVDIKVDKGGNVVSAIVNPRGTTTTNGTIRSIAMRKAMQLKLNVGDDDEQSGTILFDFKLRG